MPKSLFGLLVKSIHDGKSFDEARMDIGSVESSESLVEAIDKILRSNPKEVERYRAGETQLLGFFMGQIMKETKGKVNPQEITKILKGKL
jgi:aspartyl-tRNA(Asn)/glutamyl-tRNA(Gln) amidotransferase subunit B